MLELTDSAHPWAPIALLFWLHSGPKSTPQVSPQSQYEAISKLIFQVNARVYCKNDQFIQLGTDAVIMAQIQKFKKQTKWQSVWKHTFKISAENI